MLIALAGCNQQIGPTHQELKQDLGEQVYSLVSDFEIESTENLGSKTEPIIQSRYRAVLRFNTDDIKDPVFLEEMKRLDRINKDFVEIHGLSTSKRKGSQWETKFTIEERKNLLKE
ncbi:hypothetical protein [Acaryochloris marina]|uniref:hypothetical protein n=1 Tax=Acaryochloris marina TaxID=155978 RepID=UPI001BAEC3D7|nr:hypothetical protein [Acaryochloris marina]QUY45445.1 hypothetical protein I1H34_27085 [Acaryochloris marina S15]